MAAFDDLIPPPAKSGGAFDDLVPVTKGAFDDLLPQGKTMSELAADRRKERSPGTAISLLEPVEKAVGKAAEKLSLSPQTVQDAHDWVAGQLLEAAPGATDADKAQAEELAGGKSRPAGTAAGIAAGAQNVGVGVGASLADPKLLPLMLVGGPAGKLVLAGFAAKAAAELPGQMREAGEASVDGTPFEKTKAFLAPAVSAAFIAEGARGAKELFSDLIPQSAGTEGQAPVQTRGIQPVEKPLEAKTTGESDAPAVTPNPEAAAPSAVVADESTIGNRPSAILPQEQPAEAALAQAEVASETGPGINPENGNISEGPGGASPGDIPTEDQLHQLTETTQSVTPVQAPLSQRLNIADSLANALAGIKPTVQTALTHLRTTTAALHNSLTNLPAFTDFKRSLGEWLGANQAADFRGREFVKQLNKAVPQPDRRAAITNWIQADGDDSLLSSRAAASSGSLKRGYELAQKLTSDEKILARNISSYLDARLQQGMSAGLLKHGVENYVNQMWKRNNPVTLKLQAETSNGLLAPDFKSARKRVFDSFFEGEQLGHVPASKDIGKLIAVYDQSFNRALLARAFLKQMTTGKASDGRPLTAVSGRGSIVADASGAPEALMIKPNIKPEEASDYRVIDHPAMRGWRWMGQGQNDAPILLQGDLLVHPEAYNHLNNVLSGSWLRKAPVLSQIMKAQTIGKQTLFSLSPFHQVQEGTHALGHKVNPLRTVKLDFDNPAQRELVNHGLQIASHDAYQGLQDGYYGGGLINHVPVVGKLQQAYTDWLFHDHIPRLKMTMALDAMQRNESRYAKDIASGKISRDQLLEMTARQANAAFGEQNLKYMGRNPTFQDAMRLFLIAPDFLESRARFVGQAVKPYGREQLQALGLIAAGSYITARLMNKAIDDDYHFEKPFAVVHKGRQWEMRTVPTDLMEMATDFRRFGMNRASLGLRSLVETMTGRDYRGIPIDGGKQLKDMLTSIVPMSVKGLDKKDDTMWQAALNASGLRNKPYTATMEIHELAHKFNDSQGVKPIPVGDSDYHDLRQALENDRYSDAREELFKLAKAGKSFVQIREAFQRTAAMPFTGSSQRESQFVASLSADQRYTYETAKRERNDTLAKLRAVLPITAAKKR